MKKQDNTTVLVIGAGLAGLTAARQILDKKPDINVIVLEALDRVGGRTLSVKIEGTTYDLGAQYFGKTQLHALELARQSKCQLDFQDHSGIKIMDFNNKPSQYKTDIPTNVGILGLIQLQWILIKVDWMAKKVPKQNPLNCQMATHWDSITVAEWIRKNIWSEKVRKLMEIAIRTIYGVQLSQISLLFFLWFVNQNEGINNLIGVENGLQQQKSKNGTQRMSLFLKDRIEEKGGKIILNSKIQTIIQNQNQVIIQTQQGKKYAGEYLIIACPPTQVNRMNFTPKLSIEKRYINNKSFMGLTTKVLLLYKEQYWKNKGYSGEIVTDCSTSPILCSYDETKPNDKGQLQPAIFTFINGGVYKQWTSRQDMQKIITDKYAEYFKCDEMRHPIAIKWAPWDRTDSIGGGYFATYGPGTLTNVQTYSIRQPEGRIHWAGTQTALISTGYMDGAIESGKRCSKQIIQRLQNQGNIKQKFKQKSKDNWYINLLKKPFKIFQWL